MGIDLKGLMEAYLRVTYGYDEPDFLRMAPELAAEFRTEHGRVFMNAKVVPDASLPPDGFTFENSMHPPGTEHWERFRTEGRIDRD